MIQYEDFSIKIEPQREGVHPVIVLHSPAGEARGTLRLPFDPDALGEILVDLGRTVRGSSLRPTRETAPGATRTFPQRVGDQLFNALFAGPVRSLLDQSLGMIRERQKGLRIKLHIDPEDNSLARLASLPWELMYRKENRDFLNLSRYTPIVRYLDVQVPCIPLGLEPPLRILVVISEPVDYAALDLEHERAQIERTWAQQAGVEVSFLEAPTISALHERLGREPFHALHYMGHGGFDPRSGSGVLFLEDGRGHGVPVDGQTLGVLLRDVPTLRLVFLNACETARVSREAGLDPFAGVAAAIVMAGIPAVVAMQFPISDVAAIRFAGRFYSLAALGEPVDYAVAEGRRAIRVAEGGTMEWATPILFMRAPDGVLFRVTEAQRPSRPRPKRPIVDPELEERLEELYIAGLSAFWLEEWDRACHYFQQLVDQRPDYKDATAKLEEAQQKWHLNELYSQAQAARQDDHWSVVLARLEELVVEDPGYKDAAALLELARRQQHLADLYAQARQLHHAGQWQAVVRVFDQIAAFEPDYPDPDDLLATARTQAAELARQAELNDLYSRAVLEMDAGNWEGARQLLTRLQEQEPGYRGADRLLARVQDQIRRMEEERQRQQRIAGLYERAVSTAGNGQWAQALALMDEIHNLDPAFADPQDIAARARDELERQERLQAAEAEAARQRQQQIADLYERAVSAAGNGQWAQALALMDEIRALNPAFADPQGIGARSRDELERQERLRAAEAEAAHPPKSVPGSVAEPESVPVMAVRPRRAVADYLRMMRARLPLWVWVVGGGGLAALVILAVVLLSSARTPLAALTPTATPTPSAAAAHTLVPSNTPAPVPEPSVSADTSGEMVEVVRWGEGQVISEIALSHDGTSMAIATYYNIYLYDLRTLAKEWGPVNADLVMESVAFSPDGGILASGSRAGTVRLSRASDGSPLRTLEGHEGTVYSLAFSPDGETLASGSGDGTVRMWRVSDGRLLRTLEGHEDQVMSVAFSPSGGFLASGSGDDTVRLWRVSDGRLLSTLTGHENDVTSVAFSPDGETLASGSRDSTVRLWRVSDRRLLHILEGHEGSVRSVAFSPEGETLASGSVDSTVRTWRVSDGSLLDTLEGHESGVYSVVFSPDGETLYSGSWDGTIRLWAPSGADTAGSPIDTASGTATPPSAGATWTRPKDGMVMVYVPAGEFRMGSTQGSTDEEPVHDVYLDGFWIDKYEVTNAQFAAFLNEPGSQTEGNIIWLDLSDEDCLIKQVGGTFQPKSGYADHPVIEVTWYGARAYCEWADGQLPTEAQWEYAARGPEAAVYPWGNEFDCAKGNFDDEIAQDDYVVPGGERCDGYERTAPVGSFPSGGSWIGALDLSGNVWEWVWDKYGEYSEAEQENPTGPAGGLRRVTRGGSWLDDPDRLRCANRDDAWQGDTYFYIGFRCAMGSD